MFNLPVHLQEDQEYFQQVKALASEDPEPSNEQARNMSNMELIINRQNLQLPINFIQ